MIAVFDANRVPETMKEERLSASNSVVNAMEELEIERFGMALQFQFRHVDEFFILFCKELKRSLA